MLSDAQIGMLSREYELLRRRGMSECDAAEMVDGIMRDMLATQRKRQRQRQRAQRQAAVASEVVAGLPPDLRALAGEVA